ncbi:helix-turn-helix domain-containing protein [Thermus caldilimi]|uniref:helix-turn-helix domain-containing protein n=1 Tax=Thermus caldilimi TaxID=2483360 RepID=UPI001076B283|nr:helix-turn-helix domain-containing protein [Thermus caldilimi]
MPPKMKLLTSQEVATLLKKSVLWVRREIRSGRLKAVKVGREWRVLEKDLALFLGLDTDISVPTNQPSKEENHA